MSQPLQFTPPLDFLAENVLPSVRKRAARSASSDAFSYTYDPDAVSIHDVTGGFNAILQISANACLRQIQQNIAPLTINVELNSFVDWITHQTQPFADPVLEKLRLYQQPLYPGYMLHVQFRPSRIQFGDDRWVDIALTGEISLSGFMWLSSKPQEPAVALPGPSLPQPDGIAEIGSPEAVVGLPGPEASSVAYLWSGGRALLIPSPAPSLDQRALASLGIHGAPQEFLVSAPPEGVKRGDDVAAQGNPVVSGVDKHYVSYSNMSGPYMRFYLTSLGRASILVSSKYIQLEPARWGGASVGIDLSGATIAFESPPGDGEVFYSNFIKPREGWAITALKAQGSKPIVPEISLIGARHAAFEFEAGTSIFPINGPFGQVLTVAFNSAAGNYGTDADVKPFIGRNDYGYIVDSDAIAKILRHKWNHGGFKRDLKTVANVQVELTTSDGSKQIQDATVEGVIQLETLDAVRVETDSNSRSDYIQLSGLGRFAPDKVTLEDGTSYGPDKVDLGDSSTLSWVIPTMPAIDAPLSSDPQIQEFQYEAYHDAYRYLGRPFAHVDEYGQPAVVVYCRLTGVSQHIFTLGRFEFAFP